MDTSGYYPQLTDNDPIYEIIDYTQLLKQKLEATSDLEILHGRLGTRGSFRNNIVFAGSSTINGGGASSYDKSVVGLTAKQIYAAYPKFDGSQHYKIASLSAAAASTNPTPGIRVVNAGVGGTTSANYLTETTRSQVNTLGPAAIFHMVGSNDYSQQMPIATYKANMEIQVNAMNVSNCVHILMHAFPRRDVVNPTILWEDYGNALKEIADSRNNVVFIDLSKPFTEMDLPPADPYDLIGPDDIHATDAGHALMASTIKDALTLIPQQQDTGWVTLTPLSGFAHRGGQTMQYRVVNGHLSLRGGVVANTGNLATGYQKVAQLPVLLAPGVQNTDIGAAGVGAFCMCYVETGGGLVIWPSVAHGYVMFGGLTYPLEEMDN